MACSVQRKKKHEGYGYKKKENQEAKKLYGRVPN